jgi:hypothetical protein
VGTKAVSRFHSDAAAVFLDHVSAEEKAEAGLRSAKNEPCYAVEEVRDKIRHRFLSPSATRATK